jgi:predicted TPR repeat methyltransferase
MKVFDRYATFYDTCYALKDYEGEVSYVLDLAQLHADKDIRRILDMGCGTGSHALSMARRGFEVVGFDISDTMIEQAETKIAAAKTTPRFRSPVIRTGDLRTYRDGTTYDLCVSMFAVMGYLTTNEDFVAGLGTARAHLSPGGLLIFDVWFGPAVLTQRPEHRCQEFHEGRTEIVRLVTPELDVLRQVTTVHYRILEIQDETVVSDMRETHEMRYFFLQELKLALWIAGFDLIALRPFGEKEKEATVGDWNVCVIARAIEPAVSRAGNTGSPA